MTRRFAVFGVRQPGHVAVGARAGHLVVRVGHDQPLGLQERELALAVRGHVLHQRVDRPRGVVEPVEESIVADKSIDLPGKADEVVAGPALIALLDHEVVVVADADRQEIAERVLEQVLALERSGPVDREGSREELTDVLRAPDREVERVTERDLVVGHLGGLCDDFHTEGRRLEVPSNPEVGLQHDIVADILGVADVVAQVRLDGPQDRVLALQLARLHVAADGRRLDEQHRALRRQVMECTPLALSLLHDWLGGELGPSRGEAPDDLAIDAGGDGLGHRGCLCGTDGSVVIRRDVRPGQFPYLRASVNALAGAHSGTPCRSPLGPSRESAAK